MIHDDPKPKPLQFPAVGEWAVQQHARLLDENAVLRAEVARLNKRANELADELTRYAIERARAA